MSAPWLATTFSAEFEQYIRQTTYITANPHSRELDDSRFQHVVHLYKTDWDSEFGNVTPDAVTDHTISAGRRKSADRIIAHYMQPHIPFVDSDLTAGFDEARTVGEEKSSVWDDLRAGRVSQDEVWSAYQDTLRYVLDDITRLLQNFDGIVAITADHGNALGEYGCYGHPRHTPIPPLLRVPWVTINAMDRETSHPNSNLEVQQSISSDSNIEERLESLGYR